MLRGPAKISAVPLTVPLTPISVQSPVTVTRRDATVLASRRLSVSISPLYIQLLFCFKFVFLRITVCSALFVFPNVPSIQCEQFLRASAMLKHVIDIGWTSVRLSVCLSVSLSVRHTLAPYQNG